MAWPTLITSILYYTFLPVITVFGWLLIPLAPLLHLGSYFLATAMLPLRIAAKFETLYIYLGVAAFVGLFTGSLLHLSSTMLVSVFNLHPTPEEPGRSAASVRAAREKKKLDEAWLSSASMPVGEPTRLNSDTSMQKWLEKDAGRRREDTGVLGQTILEEDDDDSEDVF
ncbi:hypothetical protein PVAG01_02402 [Phlyctema vagabunda]|uniref:Uncharacterized protein n=1 Tax=Phlyctema vagabunda TaxID=108571 RepID=A0ABR4PQI5_9HELO